jgi:predicted MFS family arabinose efflux permease
MELLRKRPAFRRLWLATLTSSTGSWLSYVAVSALVLEQSVGLLGLALTLLAHAALTVAMLVTAHQGAVAMLGLLVLARSALEAFVQPALSAAAARLVEPGELLSANAVTSATWSVGFAAGMGAGGLVASVDPVLAIAVDALSFAAAAWLVRRLPAMPPRRDNERHERGRGEIATALATARRSPELLEALLAKAPLALGSGGTLLVLTAGAEASDLASGPALAIGLLQLLRGIGTGVGPALAARLVSRGVRPVRLRRVVDALGLASMVAFALLRSSPWAWSLAFAWGMASGTNWVLTNTAVQTLSPEAQRGRLGSLENLIASLAISAGALCGALAAEAAHSLPVASLIPATLGALGLVALGRRRHAEPVAIRPYPTRTLRSPLRAGP